MYRGLTKYVEGRFIFEVSVGKDVFLFFLFFFLFFFFFLLMK